MIDNGCMFMHKHNMIHKESGKIYIGDIMLVDAGKHELLITNYILA